MKLLFDDKKTTEIAPPGEMRTLRLPEEKRLLSLPSWEFKNLQAAGSSEFTDYNSDAGLCDNYIEESLPGSVECYKIIEHREPEHVFAENLKNGFERPCGLFP